MIPRPAQQNFDRRWRPSRIRARCSTRRFFYALLAELEAETLGAERALARIDEALALAHQLEQRAELAFFHRLRGEILLKRDPANPRACRGSVPDRHRHREANKARAASSCSRRLSLAKLYQSTGRPAEAHAVLAPALEGFSPTPEMPEIAEAQALLAALARNGRGQGRSGAAAATDAFARRLR